MNKIKKIKEKYGYISIETVIMFGLVLALGITIIGIFGNYQKELSAKVMGKIFEDVEIPMNSQELNPEDKIDDPFGL